MNAGEEVVDFLYSTQLQVDDEWAVRTPNGFVWWAADNAQTVEILREQTLPDGKMGYLVGVRTEMVADVELTDAALAELNKMVMQYSSMSGPVHDPETGTVSLCSLVRVHDDSAAVMGMQLSTAAILQLAEAAIALDAIEMTEHRVPTALSGGKNPGPASSMLKTQGTEAMQRLDELAIETAAHYAAVHQPEAREPSSNVEAIGPRHSLVAMPRYLNNRAASIYGGSNQIQRDIMARLLLRL